MSKWISVKDRLPEEGSYLCFMFDGYIKMCYYAPNDEDAKFGWLDMWRAYLDGTVTHWQPLPQPPTNQEV